MKPLLRLSYPALAALALGFIMLGVAVTGYAFDSVNPTGTSTGKTAAALSCQMYHQGKTLIQGNIGVLIGLILVFSGLWGLVNGKGWFQAVTAIIVGAAIPSLPGLLEGFIDGYRTLMIESGLSPEEVAGSTNAEVGDSAASHGLFDIKRMSECTQSYRSNAEWAQNAKDAIRGGMGF